MSSMGSLISCTTHAVCFCLFLCCSNLAWASGFHEVVATFAWFVVAFLFACLCVACIVCLHLSSYTVSRLGLSPCLFSLMGSSSIGPGFVFVAVAWSLVLFEYSLSGSFVLSCVLCALHVFLCGSSIKIGCCKLGPLWPCLSPPAPTLIHRCSSNIHAPALSAWVVFWAYYKQAKIRDICISDGFGIKSLEGD